MGESFQDHSLIQDFEADFPKKVSLKMLNWTDCNASLISEDKTDHLKMKVCIV